MNVLRNPIFAFVLLGLAVVSYFFLDLNLSIYQHDILIHAHPQLIQVFSKITLLGVGTPYLVATALIFLWAFFLKKNKGLAWMALYVLMAILVSGVICDVIKMIAGRARPTMFFSDQLYGFYFWQLQNRMLSFPSGHATTIAAVATACSLLFPRWRWVFFILVIFVAMSRVIVGAHYLSDVMVGSYLGFIIAYWLYVYFAKKMPKIHTSPSP